MAPLPSNNTAVFFLDYTDGVNNHTLQVRYFSETFLENAKQAAADFLAAMSPALYAVSVIGSRFRDAASDLTFPTVWTHDDTYGSGAMPAVNAPREFRFVGRSLVEGRRVSVSMYGVNFATPANYRAPLVVSEPFHDAVLVMSAASLDGAFLAIDGHQPYWLNYVNINFNSYWETEARG